MEKEIMIYFENDFINFHGEHKCIKCGERVSYASCAVKKFVDYKPSNKFICIDCVKKNVENLEELNVRLANTSTIGKEKFVYYDGKLAI